jgi:ADP-heptose:LPS heptosyltransferase
MELERNAMFVQYLGDADFRAGLPGLSVQPAWLREARPILERAAVGERFVVLVPGTGPPSERKWPPDRWARLAEMIVGQTAFEVVLCGSEDDKPVAREVLKRCGQAAKDLTGITSIQELAGIAAQAELLLGSDTGPVHLACALGVPSVCILGGAFPGRFFPYSVKGSDRGDATRTGPVPGVVRQGRCTCDRWNCRYLVDGMGTFPCIEGVNVEAVFREVLRAIGGTIS